MSYFNRIQLYDPAINKRQRISPIGGENVEETTRLVGTNFGSAIDAQFWTAANTGAGSASGVAAGIATLTSGTANNGNGTIKTARLARFLFANPNLWRGGMRVTAATVADCTRRFGAFTSGANPYDTPANGFGFEISATGVLSCKTWSNGSVANTVNSGSFNGDVASFAMDTNVHFYEIVYFVAGAWYFVDGTFLHHFAPTTAVLTQELTNPVSATIFNSAGGTTSGTMEVWASSILRFGKEITRPKSVNLTSNTTIVCKLGAGTLHRIVQNKAGSNTNTVTIYDNTAASGTVIGTILNTAGSMGSIEYDLDFYIGLTVISATGTAGDLTIVYD